MQNFNNKYVFIILVLVVVIIVAAVQLFQEGGETAPGSDMEPPQQTNGTSSQGMAGNGESEEEGASSDLQRPSEIPFPPAHEESEFDEVDAFSSRINAMSRQTTLIGIGEGCRLNPLVTQINLNSVDSFTFENFSDTEYTIELGPHPNIETNLISSTLGPGETRTIETSLFSEGEIMPISCNDVDFMGYLRLINQ